MTIVIDASVFIARWLYDEPLRNEARRQMRNWDERGEALFAPAFFRSEVVSVIRRAVYQARISNLRGSRLLERLFAYPISYVEDDPLLLAAYEHARRFDRPRAYDT